MKVLVWIVPLLIAMSAADVAIAQFCNNTAPTCSSARAQCKDLNQRDGAIAVARCDELYKQCMKDGTWKGKTCNRQGLKKSDWLVGPRPSRLPASSRLRSQSDFGVAEEVKPSRTL